jgi:hypothetical protein
MHLTHPVQLCRVYLNEERQVWLACRNAFRMPDNGEITSHAQWGPNIEDPMDWMAAGVFAE